MRLCNTFPQLLIPELSQNNSKQRCEKARIQQLWVSAPYRVKKKFKKCCSKSCKYVILLRLCFPHVILLHTVIESLQQF